MQGSCFASSVKINVFFAHIEIELVAVLLMGQRLSTRGDVYTVVNDVHFATHQNPSTTLMRLLRWTHRQRDGADPGDEVLRNPFILDLSAVEEVADNPHACIRSRVPAGFFKRDASCWHRGRRGSE